MKCDNCRWFNKNGFASGTGDCVLHRFVCGSGHEACEHYEEYEPRPHGTWKKDGFFAICSECGHELQYYEYVVSKLNFCQNCGADMRKEGEAE